MSSTVNPEFIERYQLEYQKNPRSKVFAPLAEAYRKMGLTDEAYRICSIGVKLHPQFASGRVAFAKILIDRKNFKEALAQLEAAVQISPDNLLAHSLMGDVLLELRKPKQALKAFKMVLFINPHDEKALAAVRKWEFLTADEYDAELFEMRPVFRAGRAGKTAHDDEEEDADEEILARAVAEEEEPERLSPLASSAATLEEKKRDEAAIHRDLERALSLADAFTIRNEIDRAFEVLQNAKKTLGPFPELNNRMALLARRSKAQLEVAEDEEEKVSGHGPRAPDPILEKKAQLEDLLQRIRERRV